MSWDKNTVNMSNIDGTILTLKKLGVPYKVTILSKVKGLGLNDDIFEEDIKGILHPGIRYYDIRKLEYKDTIILEKMLRDNDCDFDDVIVSYEFKKGQEPKDWKTE